VRPSQSAAQPLTPQVDDIEERSRRHAPAALDVEDHDVPGLTTIDGIATVEGNYPSKGIGERAAWFRDTEGNLLAIGQPIGPNT
jgi:hypothetical protein